jgi:hypothetical protein
MQRRGQVCGQVERKRSQHYPMPGLPPAPTRETLWGAVQNSGPPPARGCKSGTTGSRELKHSRNKQVRNTESGKSKAQRLDYSERAPQQITVLGSQDGHARRASRVADY